MRTPLLLVWCCGVSVCSPQERVELAASAGGQSSPAAIPSTRPSAAATQAGYILGPEDLLSIRVRDADEIGQQPYAIDLNGDIDLPRIGRIHAAGSTVEALEKTLVARYAEYLRHPALTVSVAEFRSQPVSVIGEVGSPGIHQIRGRRTLLEIISEAGGLRPDAGSTIKVARQKEWGAIPIAGCTLDPGGDYYVASIDIHKVMSAQDLESNVTLLPNDIVTIPRAEMVYVFGAVRRAGGFVLSEKESISVLEALSLAEGLDRTAGSHKAKILHTESGSKTPTEIPIDLSALIKGKVPNRQLLAGDILFVPTSMAKTASARSVDAAIALGTGIAIYHPF